MMTGLRGMFCSAGRYTVLSALFVGLIGGTAGVAQAQAKKSGAKEEPVGWVKLCQETMLTHIPKDKKKKPTQQKKMVCRTRYEQLSPFAAMSVQVQEIAGVPENGLIISFSLPQQMAIKPGILAAVYTPKQWEAVKAKKPVEKKGLKILKVGYTRCGPQACAAEVPAPKALIDDMKKGHVLMVKAFRGDGKIVEVPVRLKGFTQVLSGNPTDMAAYQKARNAALANLRARRNQILAQERARRAGAKIPDAKPIVKQ